MDRRLLPLAIIGVSCAVIYACSSSSNNTTPPPPDGGTSTSSSGSSGNPDSGTSSSGGDAGDAGDGGGSSSGATNPISGIAPLAQVADAVNAATGPAWRAMDSLFYIALPTALDTNFCPTCTNAGLLTNSTANGQSTNEIRQAPDANHGVTGNAIDKNGFIVSTEQKSVTRTTVPSDGGFVDLATAWDGGANNPLPFDTPKNLVVRQSDGTIYFTDPGLQSATATNNHVFRLPPGNTVAISEDQFADASQHPDGIAITADGSTLYVSVLTPNNAGVATAPIIKKYAIAATGALTPAAAPFASFPIPAPAGAIGLDGLAVDNDGNVYAAYKNGFFVLKPDGTAWAGNLAAGTPSVTIPAAIATAGNVTGLAFGGTDHKLLFVTTDTGKFLTTTVNVAGH